MTDPVKVDTWGKAVTIALVAIFLALISHRTVTPYLEAKRDLEAFQEAIRILSDAEGSVDMLDAEIKAVAMEIEESEALLPRTLDIDTFLEQVSEIARKSKVRVEKLNPHVSKSHKLYNELPIDVRVSGPFLAIYDFLSMVEEGGRLTRVERLLLDKRAEGGCQAELRLSLFFAGGGSG